MKVVNLNSKMKKRKTRDWTWSPRKFFREATWWRTRVRFHSI